MNSAEFVDLDTAILLKENGFDIPCKRYYFTGNGQLQVQEIMVWNWNDMWEHAYSCPTVEVANKWIKENGKDITVQTCSYNAMG